MANRILWDKYETALLIDTYLHIADGRVDRKDGVNELSKELRKRAIAAGIEIDDIYRNENGITMQLGKIEQLMLKKPDAQKHNTKLFIDMVDMYSTDQDQFNQILNEAKGAQPMESRQDKFFSWLSKEVPPFRMSDYFLIIGELESIARKKGLLRGSLFDVVDPAITGKIVTAVTSDKVFRFTHKKQVKNIIDLAQHFDNYTKKQAQKENRLTTPTRSEPVNQQKTESQKKPISDPVIEKVFSALDHTLNPKQITEENTSAEEIQSIAEESSDEKNLSETRQEVVETSRLVDEKDPILTYLEQCGLQYLDYRHKKGCLWVIGGQNIADRMGILQKNGVRMYFKAGGGNVSGGKDAWWTKDTTSKPIECSDKSIYSTVTPAPEEKPSQISSIQEDYSAFQSWMESRNISKSSARTAAWTLTRVSDIAIEQGIAVDPLYSICDAKEVAYIIARLEGNNVFQKYRQQNTVALLAVRMYAAFRAGLRDISGTSHPSASQSLMHPGRLEFELWLKENNCPTGSIIVSDKSNFVYK